MRPSRIICSLSLLCLGMTGLSQTRYVSAISTDDDILFLFRAPDKKFVLPVAFAVWDEWVKGTSFTSGSLPFGKRTEVIIEIAGRKTGKCNSGIGFSCSIYRGTTPAGIRVDSSNRFCPVSLIKRDKMIMIIFPYHVDWESLAAEPSSLQITKY